MAYNTERLLDIACDRLDVEPRIRLTELAQCCGVCRQTMEKAIRAATGRSFRRWRAELLEQKARSLLDAGGAHSIKEIAYALGYGSPQAFARFMKTACGRSPSELRRAGSSPPAR